MKKDSETINERIAKIRAHYCKGNNIQFASQMGESPNTTSNWASKSYAKIGLNVILKISDKFPNVDLNWLIKGKGEMEQQASTTDNSLRVEVLQKEIDSLKTTIIEKDKEIIAAKDKLINVLEQQVKPVEKSVPSLVGF